MHNTIQDTTKIIKLMVLLELALVLLGVTLSIYLESYLPKPLRIYLNSADESELGVNFAITQASLTVVLVLYFASIVGILRTKFWGKNLYILASIFTFILLPFLDHTIEHSYSYVLLELGVLVQGGIIAMLVFSNSAFNKFKNENAASGSDASSTRPF